MKTRPPAADGELADDVADIRVDSPAPRIRYGLPTSIRSLATEGFRRPIKIWCRQRVTRDSGSSREGERRLSGGRSLCPSAPPEAGGAEREMAIEALSYARSM